MKLTVDNYEEKKKTQKKTKTLYIYIYIYLNNLLCPLLISLCSKAILINYMPTLNQRSC